MGIEQTIVAGGTIMIVILGLLIGSFLNVCIYRIPIKKSIAYGRSYCTNCKNIIKPYDLVPVLSYLILGGKCRFCKEKISMRYPTIEILTGLLYGAVFLRFGYTTQTVIMCTLASILIVASMIDFDIMEIP
ncbi:MAG: prepilin peptidase, partial [Oscillospiraceae bacterium]